MHTENSIIMRVPAGIIFETAADLSRWTDFLPHYRWVKYIDRSSSGNIVRMAAKRNWLPVKWTSIQEIDRVNNEVRFIHLKSFTKGMRVVWTFTELPDGTEVRIRHDLQSTIPIIGTFIASVIVGKIFVRHIADQTLQYMKAYLENQRAQ